jgi:hypothetical protein
MGNWTIVEMTAKVWHHNEIVSFISMLKFMIDWVIWGLDHMFPVALYKLESVYIELFKNYMYFIF